MFLFRKNLFLLSKYLFLLRKNLFLLSKYLFLLRKNLFLLGNYLFLLRKSLFLVSKYLFLVSKYLFLLSKCLASITKITIERSLASVAIMLRRRFHARLNSDLHWMPPAVFKTTEAGIYKRKRVRSLYEKAKLAFFLGRERGVLLFS